ncbi:MAG: hypothetical protein GY940_39755 [bacterium]|nr:hypothetical protein [bacterium]
MIVKVRCKFPAGDLLFATQNLQDDGPTTILANGGNWRNRILTISSLSRNIGEDKSYEISGISIEFNDTDRYFRAMMTGQYRYIAGKTVELYSQTDQLIYTGTVEKWQFREDSFQLTINDKLSGLETLIPGIMTSETFPNMVEEAEGQPIPVIYGNLYVNGGAVKCWRVNESGTDGIFLLARHHCQGILDFQLDDQQNPVYEVYLEDGTAITEAVLDNNADGNAYIQCSAIDEDFVFANVEGKTDAGSNLIDDPVDALKDLIDSYTAITYNTVAMDEAQTIMNDRGYIISTVIGQQQNLNDVLVDFCFSFDCDFHIGKGNEIIITLLNRATLTPVKSFTSHRIVDFSMDELPEEIRNKVKYQYKYDFAREKYKKLPIYSKPSSIANWGEFYNRNDSLDLKYLSDDISSFDVVQRYLIQRKNPRRVAQVSIPLEEFVGVELGDIIEIQHPGAVDDNIRKYQVRRINIDFLSDVMDVEAVDITTLTGGIFILGDSDTMPAAWSGGSESNIYRDYGYLADGDTGYFSNDTDYGKVLY